MNNIIVSMYNKSQNEAGPKAKIDVENFLKIYVANFICHSSQFFYCVKHNKKTLIKFLADMLKIFQWQN